MLLIPLLILLAQGIPGLRADTATISGVLRVPAGMPLAGVRVAAASAPDPNDKTATDTLVSIAETDKDGRYRLENVPAGRYYITAGRVDLPTFYPGTLDVRAGTVVTVAQGGEISGIDFLLKDESFGRAVVSWFAGVPGLSIALNIVVEGGGRVPMIAGETYPVVRLTQRSDVAEFLLNAPSAVVPIPSIASPGEYQVELADLPEGYVAKSITYGSGANAVDLTKNLLRLSFPQSQTVSRMPGLTGARMITSAQADQTVFVVLSRTSRSGPGKNGVRVSGSGLPSDIPIYLSGVPGIIYTDGSFEFEGVQPGRHSLVRAVSPSVSQGIAIVVGERNVDGVKLVSTNILPRDIETGAPRPAGGYTAGTILPLSSIRGRVVDGISGEPLTEGGAVTIVGYRNSRRAYAIDGEGRFEIPDLLPGSYRLELGVSGYQQDVQTAEVDDGGLEFTFRGRKSVQP